MRAVAAIVLLAGGCDRVFEISTYSAAEAGAIGGDGTPSSPCTGKPFGPLEAIPGFAGGNAPTITQDELEILYQAGTLPPKIVVTTRSTKLIAFPTAYAILATPANQRDPALAIDGTLVFLSDDGGGQLHAWRASPVTRSLWNDPTRIAELATITMAGIDVSPDGNTIYYADLAHDLHAWRSATSVSVMLATGIDGPTVSADERELFWNGSGGVFTSVRTRSDVMFDPGTLVFAGEGDPDLTPDGKILITSMGLHRRSCN